MPTMPSRPSAGAVAPRRDAARSPATPEEGAPPEPGVNLGRVAPSAGPRQRRPKIVVKGGAQAGGAGGSGLAAPLDYPVQPSKIQSPPLRDDTLARDRLLDWLSIKIHGRVVLLVAEAGYGKTTLLADFSRRTRVRVLWFRLDRGDRDWVGFMAHLVAAVRVHQPAFGASTAALLRQTATTAPPIEAVLDTFLRELATLPNDPTAFVFDDVHLVDDAADVRQILRELLARGPERMSFVFSSRREPPIRLARLRALGEVAEIDTDDLRFDPVETERLFTETYEMPLEPSVLVELNRRTEGWAASLQLVRAALHDRNPAQVRTFISSLSGAEGHLYEYLAEEVVGDLEPDLQEFLMRTSVLDTVDLILGPVAAGITEAETRAFMAEAERHGLFGKRGPQARSSAKAHPLVRDFLQARLNRAEGPLRVREIHARVAKEAESVDWHVSARHYQASGQDDDASRVLSSSIELILARGSYVAGQDIAASLSNPGLVGPIGLVLASRIALQKGAAGEALELAEQAWAMSPTSTAVVVNLAAARALAGDVVGSLDAAHLLELSGRAEFASIGRAMLTTMRASVDGSIEVAERDLVELASSLEREGATHYLGVALLNRSILQIAMAEFSAALDTASSAISQLEASSAGIELVSAHVAHASALAFLGDIGAAREEIGDALRRAPSGQAPELAADIAEMEALVGETARAWPLIRDVADRLDSSTIFGEQVLFARSLLSLQDGDIDRARRDIAKFRHGQPTAAMAFEAKRLLAEGLLLALEGVPGASAAAIEGRRLAATQGARFWARFGETLTLLADRDRDPSDGILRTLEETPSVISSLAELVLSRLSDLAPQTFAAVATEAERRPWRWRPSTRRALQRFDPPHVHLIARLLERIGEAEDIERLRDAGRRGRGRAGLRLGLTLARRLADRVFVEDLGRVQIAIGTRVVEGGEVRRKVLALLCLLLSRPKFSSTRDEVLDSLWPEHDPTSALNSLNQTVYFLRRVFEPEFRDETSPGYVGQDGETIWLDSNLIDCRSRRCLQIIRSMPRNPTPEGSIDLAAQYRGRFALDFAYEEWSGPYRDALHAAYLRVVEHAVRLDLDSGHFDRGTFIAERASEVDPDSEEIQAALVRLYRHSGAHAAAAEQYAHYAHVLRDLGVEPPALVDV